MGGECVLSSSLKGISPPLGITQKEIAFLDQGCSNSRRISVSQIFVYCTADCHYHWSQLFDPLLNTKLRNTNTRLPLTVQRLSPLMPTDHGIVNDCVVCCKAQGVAPKVMSYPRFSFQKVNIGGGLLPLPPQQPIPHLLFCFPPAIYWLSMIKKDFVAQTKLNLIK